MIVLKWYSILVMSLALIINLVNTLKQELGKEDGLTNLVCFILTIPIVIYLIWG